VLPGIRFGDWRRIWIRRSDLEKLVEHPIVRVEAAR
jgi:hypothetical protein